MPILVIERGNDKGRSLKLEPGKSYVFGRDADQSAIALSDTLTSRRHFQVRSEDNKLSIRDLSSTNGTFLNDERIEVAQLKVGDKIQAGETILSVLSDQREDTPQGLVGKTIGGYRILERVGRGGMGTVFKANQLSLNRTVALKVLSSRLLKDDKFIDRFNSEARAAGQMNHPNIVQVYDVGTDRNLHFFSMEFMDGQSLQDRVGKDSKLEWGEVLDTLIQAARGLVFAEKNGIIHRDVKPDNLMLTLDGQIKLADLGLARRRTDATQAPEEGIFGTPHFISPEQAQGKELDHRADLYSLGATAYRLLSGRTPFQGSNVKEIITQQITATPAPLKKQCPDAPEELIAQISKLMEKNPDNRHASAGDLLADLEAIQLKYHLKAKGVGGGKGVLIAVSLALLAVAAVVIFALTKKTPEPVNPDPLPIASTTATQPIPSYTPDRPPPSADPEVKAKNAYLVIQIDEKDLGKLNETWKSQAEAWKEIARRYEAVGEEFAETESGEQAAQRAIQIAADLERLAKEESDRLTKAGGVWSAHRMKVENALLERKFAEALKLAREIAKTPTLKQAAEVVEGAADLAATWTGGPEVKGSIAELFALAWAEVKQNMTDLTKRQQYAEAAGAGRTFLTLACGEERRGPFGAAWKEFEALVDGMKAEFRGVLESKLQADRKKFYDAYLAARHLRTEEPYTPVYQFRFEAAADIMKGLLKGDQAVTSEPYRSRVERKIRQFTAMAALMDSLVAHFATGDLRSEALELPKGMAGRAGLKKVEFHRGGDPFVNREGIAIAEEFRYAGNVASAKRFLRWESFSPSELWQHIFLSGKRWKMTPEEMAGAAHFLAETGVADNLAEMIEGSGAALDSTDRAHLDRELKALRSWEAVRDVTETRPAEDWIIANSNFVKRHASSDVFILVYGHDIAGDRLLFPRNVIDQWLAEKLLPLEKDD